jgi:hypothetical protein
MTMVWVPIVNEDASTVSSVAVEGHALRLADVVPVTEILPPTVSCGVRIALTMGAVDIKIGEALPAGVKRNPSTEPSAA